MNPNFEYQLKDLNTNEVYKSATLEVIQFHVVDLMWKSILKNQPTFQNPCDHKLNYPLGSAAFDQQIRPVFNGTFPSVIYSFNYRFVSCGRSEYSALPFFELVSSFQGILWGWIVPVIFIVFPLSLEFIVQKFKKFKTSLVDKFVMSSYKLVLEQGDPFTEKVI